MRSIPVAISRNSINKFKRHYLRKKKRFEDFLLHLWNLHEMKNIFSKKDEYPSLIISEIIESQRGGNLNI